ncbi:hypothetical protein [Agromyces seonyuensis]|uniref:Uncharacterized protein n=1 Tax=Agromyces seonyuensis TaxID=2662446 RepID=A0A6I4P3F3_9MICO|nr:hypothetical protein [Agromyces seonyuensis]MWB97857.1 hypothetical protein [Agromyces seonyuensis]
MTDQLRPVRPFGVTLVAAFTWLTAAMDIVAAILLFALLGVDSVVEGFGGAGTIVALAVVTLLVGILAFVFAFGLVRGNPVARLAVTAIQVLAIGASIWRIAVDPAAIWSEGLSILLGIAIILLLWMGEASRWFAGLSPNEPSR